MELIYPEVFLIKILLWHLCFSSFPSVGFTYLHILFTPVCTRHRSMPYLQKLQQLQQLQPVSTTLPTFCKIFCKPGDVCQTISNQTTANMALGMNNLYVCRAACGCLQLLLIIGQQHAGNNTLAFSKLVSRKIGDAGTNLPACCCSGCLMTRSRAITVRNACVPRGSVIAKMRFFYG